MTKKTWISLIECAELINIDRSNLLKYIKEGKYGYVKTEFRRDINKKNQKVITMSIKDFEMIKKIREKEGFGTNKVIKRKKGVFYIIQTNPKHIPCRYKFGFTTDLANRVRSYKSICPNLKVVKKYSCNFIHELPLLKMIEKCGKRVGQELFELEDIKIIKMDIREVLQKLIPQTKRKALHVQ